MSRKIWFLISMLAILFLANNVKAELVAYYSLDEGAGDVVADGSGNGYDGTIEGDPTWVDGAPGFNGALQFGTAGSDRVNCGQWDNTLGTEEMTVGCWVNFSTGGTTYQGIVANRSAYNVDQMYWALEVGTAGGFYFGSLNGSAYGLGTLPEGEWAHVAVTFDGEALVAYLDGEESNTGSPAYGNTPESTVYIGNSDNGGNIFEGIIDEVYFFNTIFTVDEIVQLMNGEMNPGSLTPGKAKSPKPENNKEDVAIDTILSWTPGEFPCTHNVYFSADFNDVNDSTALMSEQQSETTYDPGILEYGTTYYWRIDEVNDSSDATVHTGSVWTFTTEAYAQKIPSDSITVNASSQESEDEGPINTIDESGLDPNAMDLHSKDTTSMWSTDDANSADLAWIQYDFDKAYKLHQMLVWNYNGQSLLSGFGIKDVNIEYSEDGENWTQLSSTTQFARGTGLPGYKYNTTVEFNGLSVKSVRINAINNWGGIWYPQFGLSEVRFLYIPVRAREPYPDDANDIAVDETLTWRAGRDAVEHTVSYSTDEQAIVDGTAASETVSQTSYGPLSLDLGSTYYWRVDEVGDSITWTGDLWSFRTAEYIIVEDFESYDDDEPNRVWDAWVDGWFEESNGSTMGYPDPDFDNDEHFVETTVVHNGDQSGPLIYDNTDSVNYSEVELVLDSAQDWTSNAADEVVMSIRGNAVTFEETDDGYIAMSGEGADIWANNDEFRYAYKTLNGNGSMTVRIDSLENVPRGGTNSKAGLMIRESLEDANSVMALACLHANGGTALQYRDEQSADIVQDNSGTGDRVAETPVWLRITRQGSTITAERSFDGESWEPIGEDPNEATTADVTMPNQVYIGLVVCSHVADTLGCATFYGVESTGNVSGDWTIAAVGDEEQAEGGNTLDKVYLALEDSSGNRHDVYVPTLAAAGWGNWYEWRIPQSEFSTNGVNMARIKKIIVGLGDPDDPMHGKGMIFIDDIGYGHTFSE